MRILDRFHRRRAAAERALAQSEQERHRIEEQWPVVRARSEWARETRRQNGLSALFAASIEEKHT